MTSRATFGDFARAATRHLGPPARPRARSPAARPAAAVAGARQDHGDVVAWQVREFSRGLDRLLLVMSRYLADVSATFGGVTRATPYHAAPWARASVDAADALRNARAHLGSIRPSAQVSPPPPPSSPAARLIAAANSLTVGRDLLHGHAGPRPDGPGSPRGRQVTSEWAPVISSLPVTRALLTEVAGWARQAGRRGTRLALTPATPGGEPIAEQHRLNAACQWLRVLAAAVDRAHQQDPVLPADITLLHAIPAHALEPRRLPAGTETVSELCRGTTGCAERVRHIAIAVVPHAAWSPVLTAESMSRTAGSATIVSHHCEILQHALARQAAQHGSRALAGKLTASAEAAGQARLAWLTAARAWQQFKTDARGPLSAEAAETADLALWTGRLAYADPAWTPAMGPSRHARPAGDLAPTSADLPGVLAAVHHASVTVSTLAASDHAQIRTASRAGRLLIATRHLPDTYDIPRPYTRAPGRYADRLLATYNDARDASAEATARVAEIAGATRAPSHILTLARDAITTTSRTPWRAADRDPAVPPARGGPVARETAGPTERALCELGVTDQELLGRAAAIDFASQHLLLDVARQASAESEHPGPVGWRSAAGRERAPASEAIQAEASS